MTLQDAIKKFAEENSRFTISIKSDGTIYINKAGGQYAKITPDGKYTQPKGASWRSDIQKYADLAGVTLK